MGIGSYKEAERYRMRTNKNLTRGFYLDTRRTLDEEPFAWEQPQVASIEQQGAVQGFNDGGRVERQGFEKGGDVKNTFYNLKKKLKRNPTVVEISKQVSKNFNDLSYEEKKSIYDKVIYTGKKENLNFYKTLGQPTYQLSKQIGDVNFPVATKTGIKWPNKKIKDEYEQQIINRYKYAKSSADLEEQIKLGNLLNNKQLAKNFNISKRAVERLNEQIIKEYNLKKTQPIIGREEVQKTRDIKRKEAQLKFSDPGFEQKAKGTYKAHLGHMGDLYNRIVTAKNLGYTPAEINQAMTETLDPILKNISQAQDKLIKNKPPGWKQKLEEYNKKGINYSSLAEGYKSFDTIDPNTLEKYTYGVDYLKTIDPAALYEGKPIKEIAPLTDKREINKIQKAFDDLTEAKKIARTEGLEQADISKIKNSELLTEENLKKLQDYNAFEQNREAVMKAQSKVPASEKRKVISNLTNYLNENTNEVKAFRTAGIPCRRAVGGKVDTECLAENIVKEVEKLETGTDLQKTSALNKFKNATKLGAGLAEEVIGFGRGVAGRTLGPLAALNSALEQFTSGNYREGVRKIASLADLTTLVGDPLGFEKMRTEGTIEDVRGKIGKENQASLDRILEFKDKYYQLQDINTKLERIQSAAEGQYDPETPGVDQSYINELKKQQDDLNKIINNTKYQNIRKDYLNVGNAVKNEIFGRNINAPEQNKYVFETAAQEQLKSILGEDFYDELSDENKIIFKNLTANEKIKPVYSETPIQSPDDSMREGFAEGSGPKMGRRGFLGLLTGVAALPEIIKGMKTEKKAAQVAKVATKILPEVKGMPEWFPSLVARIEKEGIDISPKATRVEDIRTVKKIEVPVAGKKEPDIVTMTKYPDGTIHIEANVYGGAFEAPFDLHYKPPKSDMDLETGKAINYPGEFSVMETRPRPAYEPGEWELDYENMSVKDAISDLEKVEKIATGKKIDPKIVSERTAARKFVEENPYDDIMNRYPDPETPDWWEYEE
jgi:hypothetical protein